MARLTVEDCIRRVANRFELVLLSAQRARELDHGAEATIDRDNDKDPVIALREIADGTVDLDVVRRKLIHGGEPPDDDAGSEGEIADEVGLAGGDAIAAAAAALASSDDEHNEAAFGDGTDSAPLP